MRPWRDIIPTLELPQSAPGTMKAKKMLFGSKQLEVMGQHGWEPPDLTCGHDAATLFWSTKDWDG